MITDSVCHLISFSTPTHTHIFGNHRNGYNHLKTADVWSSMDCRKTASSMVGNLKIISELGEDYDF
jgi:hypothetical protein